MTPVYLLTPTRKRPDMLSVSAESALDLADHPDRVKLLLHVDDDDPTDYSAWPHVLRGPRWGYAGLCHYYNALAALARELSVGQDAAWCVVWNDDEKMLTPGWDEKLAAYSPLPHVRFLRRDCTGPLDTAYPAFPVSLFDTMGLVARCTAVDTWLSIVTSAVDWLLGRNATHVYAPDVFVHHARLEEVDKPRFFAHVADSCVPAPAPDGFTGDSIEREVLLLANAHGYVEWRRPGWRPPSSWVVGPYGREFEIDLDRFVRAADEERQRLGAT